MTRYQILLKVAEWQLKVLLFVSAVCAFGHGLAWLTETYGDWPAAAFYLTTIVGIVVYRIKRG